MEQWDQKQRDQKQRIDDLLALIERNREENRSRDQGEFDGLFTSRFAGSSPAGEEGTDLADALLPQQVRLVIHAAPGPMRESLIDTMKSRVVVTGFAVPEETIHFCLEFGVAHILMDFDSPTDTHGCVDVFSVMRTLVPSMGIYVCTRNPQSIEARTLQFKGAIILPRPFLRREAERVQQLVRQGAAR